MTKVSVITVNLNNAEGLERTIKSIETQTWQDFEFIIVDGASTDGSAELIKECKRVDYCISEKDKGVYSAMNKGIRAAKGDFVIFLNSGDWFHSEEALNNVKELFDSHYDIIYGNNYDVYPKEKVLKKYPSELTFNFFYTSSLCHQSTFIRKQLFNDIFYYNEEYKIASDWEFFVYAICYKGVNYKYVNEVVCCYDMTGISSNLSNRKQSLDERGLTISKYFKAFEKDYLIYNELNSKRIQQILSIKKNKFAWRIMKWIVDLFLIFTGKRKNTTELYSSSTEITVE